LARNTLDFSSTFQPHSPTSIIMPSSSSLPLSLSLHHHHHYPLITSTTSSHHDSFITHHQLHIPKPKRGKAQEEEDEEEEKESKQKKVPSFEKNKPVAFQLEMSLL
jgi:hypothetical protein